MCSRNNDTTTNNSVSFFYRASFSRTSKPVTVSIKSNNRRTQHSSIQQNSRAQYPETHETTWLFFSLAMTLGEGSTSHSPSALFFFAFFFSLKWRSARAHQFHFLGRDQSIVSQRPETTVAQCSLTGCV